MEKQTVFIKRYPKNGELPAKSKWNDDWFIVGFSENQNYHFQGFVNEGVFIENYKQGHESVNKPFDPQPLWWLEEIELPSEEEMQNEIYHESMEAEHAYDFQQGAKHMQNFILNHLKSNTNG